MDRFRSSSSSSSSLNQFRESVVGGRADRDGEASLLLSGSSAAVALRLPVAASLPAPPPLLPSGSLADVPLRLPVAASLRLSRRCYIFSGFLVDAAFWLPRRCFRDSPDGMIKSDRME
ncbi:hypothetical protein LINPERPRIM_LOCUS13227 [Linum perenne]